MNKAISFKELHFFSNLFIDFIQNHQEENYNSIADKLSKITENHTNKKPLLQAISSTASSIELYDTQKNNIELLKLNNTLAVVSGQQAGYLGGSLYTLYKALDTYKYARKLKEKYPNYNFIPIFWIEDNDNDLEEASITNLYDKDYNIIPMKLNFDDNTVVADTFIGEQNAEIISKSQELLKDLYPNGEKYSELIQNIYNADSTWSHSFLVLMQELIGHLGILFISANKLIETGVFKDLIIKELSERELSKKLIEKKNALLEEKGFAIQAQVSDINLFYHIDNKRYRIDYSGDDFIINDKIYKKSELLEIANLHPERFSPKVLLRPLFQDYAIPTICYLAGPGEIAYHSQLDFLYQELEIVKPALLMRSSITIIDKKISRYFAKIDKSTEYFFKRYSEIEKELSEKLLGKEHEKKFLEFKSQFDDNFKQLEDYLMDIDNQLERTIKGAYVKIQDQIEQLDKKAHSFAKRNNEELLQKYKAISNSIYPSGIPQERVISPLQYLASIDNLIELILEIDIDISEKHYFIEN